MIPEETASVESRLVERAQSGDQEAFGELYDRYAQAIFRFLYAQLSHRLEAEDLTSEVFLRAWQSLPTYRERGYPFSSFLFRIARNLVIDRYRRSDWRDLPLEDDQSPGQAALGEAAAQHRELLESLAQLREEYRLVLVLRFLNGLSPQETARALKRSEGAVRVLQHRALLALRKRLE